MKSTAIWIKNASLEIAAALDERRLNLIVFPTEKCNFRCTYCYENFALGRMPEWVVKAIKSLIEKRLSTLGFLDISWFGGEPLLVKETVLELSRYIFDASRSFPNLKYAANMTTNGYLLEAPLFMELCNLGITTYQISLDGFQETHDATRHLANGEGSFKRIWSNLLAIKNTPCNANIILRIHFTSQTGEQLNPLIEKINNAFGDDNRFKVYFKAIEQLGGANDSKLDMFSCEEEKNRVKDYLEKKLLTPEKAIDYNQNYVCYAAKANSLAIRANGRIAKCTVALNNPVNDIGTLCPDGTVQLDQEKLRPWLTGLLTLDKDTLACPLGTVKNHNVVVQT